jgi:glutamate-1-semialdehyde 2,1-aminomutase
MISVFFTEQEVVDYRTANSTDQELFRDFFHEMLQRGIYLPPSPFESWFLANSLSQDMIDKTIAAAEKSIEAALESRKINSR